ncbi:2Fe-2S ferredoxin [Iodidimonas muriae]|uniref:2Fe-2S ferredoxin n=1 Tax=Iodidimonas muriae TaxID=261467 RepID=A0ABQ2LED9_9PROT|nr:2Fe-2S iron-sulfur cluster-binding protein [Iodidimonas muriae]GER07007.1 2Fe-2S ferredoxin [Kordiimonadales bacterium JCM 17843]GGO13362.1 2Fe-2S ferredoxin [Iodidimonas muriae]
MVTLTFVSSDGKESRTVNAPIGISLMKLAHFEGIDVEGACGGNLACSTCHMIFSEADFARLPQMGADEDDLLDLAPNVTATSRLGCQITVSPELDGLTIHLPPAS